MKKVMILLLVCSVIGLTAMMKFTNPIEIGPAGVLVFFTLLYIVLFVLTTFAVGFLFPKVTQKKRYFYGAAISFLPLIFLIARSFGGGGLLEAGLATVLVVISCFLIYKRL
jgi:hypothetical protein